MNLAIASDPKTWDEFYYHTKQAQILKNCLIKNKQPFSIFVSGPTGVGKTSLIRLYLRALHCLNREPGEFEPCGTCNVCNADPRTTGAVNNIVWVQRGKDDTPTAQVNKALEEAFQPPNGLAPEHRHYKAIVFDELQAIPKDKLQDLLFYPELPDLLERNKVIFIFLTMNESGIDPIICKALRSRCTPLRLRRLTVNEIMQFLTAKFPSVALESLELISKAADGSIREALSAIQLCYDLDSTLHPNDVADTLYFASAAIRKKLWMMLESFSLGSGNYTLLWDFWSSLESKVDPHRLISQLDEDLDKSICIKPLSDQLKARMYLYDFKTSYAPIQPWDVIKMLAGLRVMNYEIFDEVYTKHDRNGFERMNDLIAS